MPSLFKFIPLFKFMPMICQVICFAKKWLKMFENYSENMNISNTHLILYVIWIKSVMLNLIGIRLKILNNIYLVIYSQS